MLDNKKLYSKHAYLILVHKNPLQVRKLLEVLDNERVDIFIHIDAKTQDISADYLSNAVRKSSIHFTDRVNVEWGRFSIVEATLLLIKKAIETEKYSYLHLISGQDFPLKSIEKINEFYDMRNQRTNYVLTGDPEWSEEMRKCRRGLYLFDDNWICRIRIISKIINRLVPLRIRCNLLNNKYYSVGSAWFDINYNTACEIIKNERWIRKNYKFDLLPDEAFIQGLFRYLKLENTVYKPNAEEVQMGYNSYMRYIDWKRSPNGRSPWVFKEDDFELLINSGLNFCRKIDMDIDSKIVDKLYEFTM